MVDSRQLLQSYFKKSHEAIYKLTNKLNLIQSTFEIIGIIVVSRFEFLNAK